MRLFYPGDDGAIKTVCTKEAESRNVLKRARSATQLFLNLFLFCNICFDHYASWLVGEVIIRRYNQVLDHLVFWPVGNLTITQAFQRRCSDQARYQHTLREIQVKEAHVLSRRWGFSTHHSWAICNNKTL